jgi:hypothetical protein
MFGCEDGTGIGATNEVPCKRVYSDRTSTDHAFPICLCGVAIPWSTDNDWAAHLVSPSQNQV